MGKMKKFWALLLSMSMIITALLMSSVVIASADSEISLSKLTYNVDGKLYSVPQAGNLTISTTAAGTGKVKLIAAKYDRKTNELKDVQLSGECVLNGNSAEVSVAINITNLSDEKLKVFAWDMETLKPFDIADSGISFKDAADLAEYYAINTYNKRVRYKNLTCSPLVGKSYFDDSKYYMWQICSYGNNSVKPHSVTFSPTNVTENMTKDYTVYILAAGTKSGDKLHIYDGDNPVSEPNATVTLNNTWDLKDTSNNAPLVMNKVRVKNWNVTSDEILGLNKKDGNVDVREIYIFESKNVSDELDSVIMNSTMGKYEDANPVGDDMTFDEAAALADYSAAFTKDGIVGDMKNTNTAGGYFNTQFFAWEPAQFDNYYNFSSSKVTSDISGDYTIYILAGSYAVGDKTKNNGNGQLGVYDGQEKNVSYLTIPAETIVLDEHKTELIETGYKMYKINAENYKMTKDSVIKFNSTTKHGTFIRKIYIFKTAAVTEAVDAAMMSSH